MQDIYQILKNLNIYYKEYAHPAVYTTAEAEKHELDAEAAKCKNLFLRNQKKTSYYLVVMEAAKKADLATLSKTHNEDKLSFASPEDLLKYLNITPGSVSPFALINNQEKNIQVIIDNALMNYPKVSFHPNINTATLVISTQDFKKFLDWCKNDYQIISL